MKPANQGHRTPFVGLSSDEVCCRRNGVGDGRLGCLKDPAVPIDRTVTIPDRGEPRNTERKPHCATSKGTTPGVGDEDCDLRGVVLTELAAKRRCARIRVTRQGEHPGAASFRGSRGDDPALVSTTAEQVRRSIAAA